MNKEVLISVLKRDVGALIAMVLAIFWFLYSPNLLSGIPAASASAVCVAVVSFHYVTATREKKHQKIEERRGLLERMKELIKSFHKLTLHGAIGYSIRGMARNLWEKQIAQRSEKAGMWKYHFDEVYNLLTALESATLTGFERKEVSDSFAEFQRAVHGFLNLLFRYHRVTESFRRMVKDIDGRALTKEDYDCYEKFKNERDELVRKLRTLTGDLNKILTADAKISMEGMSIFEFTRPLFGS